ncbi:hypothetical protein LX36DRAFT_15029 [Colletotrichum falcatum]|nr:hypothetical protein LX36DRAFT_15029 [Colletotrichum falcatum]
MTRRPRGRGRLPGEFKGSSEGLSSRSIGMRLRALPLHRGRAGYSMGLILGARGVQTKPVCFSPVRNRGLDTLYSGLRGKSLPSMMPRTGERGPVWKGFFYTFDDDYQIESSTEVRVLRGRHCDDKTCVMVSDEHSIYIFLFCTININCVEFETTLAFGLRAYGSVVPNSNKHNTCMVYWK